VTGTFVPAMKIVRFAFELTALRAKVNLSTVFAGQKVGVSQVGEHLWLVSFMDFDLGHFDDETCRLEPIETPFWRKVLPM
jgi:putative transposase